jgi:hypothetical protein
VLHAVRERDVLLLLLCVYRDTSKPPAQVTNPEGTLLLGYQLSDGSGGENLDVGQFDPQFLSYGFLGLLSHYVICALQMIRWRPVLP